MIHDFYNNKGLREEVKEYIHKVFEREAVEKVFAREDVSHIADAWELMDAAFDQMEVDFGAKKTTNQLNEAR